MTLHSVTVGLLTALSLPNSPYPKTLTLIPDLTVEVRQGPAYVLLENSARCIPGEWNRWNPITAAWTVEAGADLRWIRFGVGHRSEHGVDETWEATESRDYVQVRVRLK